MCRHWGIECIMPTQPKLVPVCTNRSEVKITSESSIRAMRKAICHEIFWFYGRWFGKEGKSLLCLHWRVSEVGLCPVCLNCKAWRESARSSLSTTMESHWTLQMRCWHLSGRESNRSSELASHSDITQVFKLWQHRSCRLQKVPLTCLQRWASNQVFSPFSLVFCLLSPKPHIFHY